MSNKEVIHVMNENFKNKCVVNKKSFIDNKSCRKRSKTKKKLRFSYNSYRNKTVLKELSKKEENEKIFLY